jgi:hypothetical protein
LCPKLKLYLLSYTLYLFNVYYSQSRVDWSLFSYKHTSAYIEQNWYQNQVLGKRYLRALFFCLSFSKLWSSQELMRDWAWAAWGWSIYTLSQFWLMQWTWSKWSGIPSSTSWNKQQKEEPKLCCNMCLSEALHTCVICIICMRGRNRCSCSQVKVLCVYIYLYICVNIRRGEACGNQQVAACGLRRFRNRKLWRLEGRKSYSYSWWFRNLKPAALGFQMQSFRLLIPIYKTVYYI